MNSPSRDRFLVCGVPFVWVPFALGELAFSEVEVPEGVCAESPEAAITAFAFCFPSSIFVIGERLFSISCVVPFVIGPASPVLPFLAWSPPASEGVDDAPFVSEGALVLGEGIERCSVASYSRRRRALVDGDSVMGIAAGNDSASHRPRPVGMIYQKWRLVHILHRIAHPIVKLNGQQDPKKRLSRNASVALLCKARPCPSRMERVVAGERDASNKARRERQEKHTAHTRSGQLRSQSSHKLRYQSTIIMCNDYSAQ